MRNEKQKYEVPKSGERIRWMMKKRQREKKKIIIENKKTNTRNWNYVYGEIMKRKKEMVERQGRRKRKSKLKIKRQ